MKTLTLLCVLASTISVANAADFELTASLGSYHTNQAADYNQFNPGVGLAYKGWEGGYYHNSFSKPTFYAGYHYESEWARVGRWQASVMAVAVTGYRKPVGVLPTLTYDAGPVKLDTVLIPHVAGQRSAVVAWRVRVPFK